MDNGWFSADELQKSFNSQSKIRLLSDQSPFTISTGGHHFRPEGCLLISTQTIRVLAHVPVVAEYGFASGAGSAMRRVHHCPCSCLKRNPGKKEQEERKEYGIVPSLNALLPARRPLRVRFPEQDTLTEEKRIYDRKFPIGAQQPIDAGETAGALGNFAVLCRQLPGTGYQESFGRAGEGRSASSRNGVGGSTIRVD